MKAPSIIIRNARVLTVAGADIAGNAPVYLRGPAMSELGVIERGSVVIEDGVTAHVGEGDPVVAPRIRERALEIDARGRVVMPGFVDAHTHACWAGDRLDEWEMKQRGASYLDLLKAGGGIMSTVRDTRRATEDELARQLRIRLDAMLGWGTVAVEIKSGYGLDTETELKMLGAIARAADGWPGIVVPTALVGHAIDADEAGGRNAFIERTIDETLPAVHEAFPGVTIDAYCEEGAWSLADCARLFERATELGHPFRVHTDQFNELGMTRWAVDNGTRSVDHLEATSLGELEHAAQSGVAGVLLPCSGFHVDGRYADGRAFVDAGGAAVIATNWNPGSAPCGHMAMAIALAVRGNRLTASEAIAACTRNAATLLRLDGLGTIAAGSPANLVMLRHTDERMLGYEFGGDPVELVVASGTLAKGGEIMHE